MAKGIRPPTPHHTTSRAAAPMDMVHIDTAGPLQELLGGSRYVMFVDSAFRFQCPYGVRDKSASAILGVVKRFEVDMGVPRAFRADNGDEYTNSTFVDYRNGLGIGRELTGPYTPQQNGSVESGLSRTINAGYAARLEVNKLFPDIHLERLKGVQIRTARVCGWSLLCGHPRGSTAPRPRRAAACFLRTRSSSETARRCRSCRSASRHTIAFHGAGTFNMPTSYQ